MLCFSCHHSKYSQGVRGYHKFIHMGLDIYDVVIKAVNICLYFVLIC